MARCYRVLFVIYINDIGEKLLSLSRLFADNTSLGYSSQNVVEIENVINHDLCELNTWSTKWLMSLQLVDSRMFRKKARLILIYKFVSNKIIINIFIDYSLHNFTNTTYQRYRTVISPLKVKLTTQLPTFL
jgi:hypothetical protein